MTYKRWEDEELTEVGRLRLGGATWKRIGEHFRVSAASAECAFRRAIERGFDPKNGVSNLEPEGYFVRGASTLRDGKGNVKLKWTKTAVDEAKRFEAIKAGLAAFVSELPRLPDVPLSSSVQVKDRLASYVFGDPHFGMFASKDETGEDFNLKIAEAVHRAAIDQLAYSTPPARQGLLVLLGDNFHYDSQSPKTPAHGHLLDADRRFVHMVQTTMRALRYMIETLLRKHRSLRVIVSPGNHDPALSPFLAIALDQIYKHNKRVSFDITPGVFHYFRFGRVFIGAHHGHKTKPKDLLGVMASDHPRDWGETLHRHFYCGHLHHQYSQEYPGLVVEGFNTLASKDAYATEGGWRSKRAAKAIIYDREQGEIQRHIYFAPKPEARHAEKTTACD